MSDPTFLSRSDLGMASPASISRNFDPSGGGVSPHWWGGAQRIQNVDQAVARWLAGQRFHMGRNHPNPQPNGRHWVDIAYSFGYWKNYVFAGRGYGVRPASQRQGNSDHLSAVWIGGSGEVPTEEDFATLAWIIEDARENGRAGLSIKPHSFFVPSTACPGPDIRRQSEEWDGKRGIRVEPEPEEWQSGGSHPETPARPSRPSSTVVGYGDRGSRVREWQTLLISKGFDIPAGATGNFLEQTVRATQQAYAAVGLSASDPNRPRVGQRSFAALQDYEPQPWRGKRVVARRRVAFYRTPGWQSGGHPVAGFLDEGWGFRGGIHQKRRVGGGYQYLVSNSNGDRRWITTNERFIRLLDR